MLEGEGGLAGSLSTAGRPSLFPRTGIPARMPRNHRWRNKMPHPDGPAKGPGAG